MQQLEEGCFQQQLVLMPNQKGAAGHLTCQYLQRSKDGDGAAGRWGCNPVEPPDALPAGGSGQGQVPHSTRQRERWVVDGAKQAMQTAGCQAEQPT